MSAFRFLRLRLVSNKDRKAREIRFHPNVTVIQGENSTGKSSVVRSLFRTFGAEPADPSERWSSSDVKSAVDFELNQRTYTLLRDGGTYALFDGDARKPEVFTRVTTGLGPRLARLFSFGLQLKARGGEPSIPPPAFFFLPFYIDHERSWSAPWAGFINLGQFEDWRRDVAEYHAGLRPSEYYQRKAAKKQYESDREQPRAQLASMKLARERVAEHLDSANLPLMIDQYRDELNELVAESNKLRETEQSFRAQLVGATSRIKLAEQQLTIVQRAELELQRDYDFATFQVPGEALDCPLCGQHYENSFAQRFSLASNQQRCSEIASDVRTDIDRARKEEERAKAEVVRVEAQARRVRDVLAKSRDGTTLDDVVRSAGRRELRSAFSKELETLEATLGEIESKIEEARVRMARFDDPQRQDTILEYYREQMRTGLQAMQVFDVPANHYKKLVPSIRAQGSEKPRAVLAYFMAFLRVTVEHADHALAPVVIDSPNQQDQDPANLAGMLSFIRQRHPESLQLILAAVDAGHAADGAAVITLDEKYGLLNEKAYTTTGAEMNALISRSIAV